MTLLIINFVEAWFMAEKGVLLYLLLLFLQTKL